MAEIQHSGLPSSACHEPKHISEATTADAGKVLTPSSTDAGQSVLRRLTIGDLEDLNLFVPAYAILASTGTTSKSIPDNSGTATEINSLFPISSSNGITSVGTRLQFDVGGSYLVTMIIDGTGTSSKSVALYYEVNDIDPVYIANVATDGSFSIVFSIDVSEGDTMRFTAISSDDTSVSFRPSKNISIARVS